MEYNQNLLYNFASIIATLLFVSAAGVTIFRRLKLRWPVRANCWFCNTDTKIYSSQLDWWWCSACEQYNGFTKDGDYAYDIPEQSTQLPDSFAQRASTTKEDKRCKSKNSLCDKCNRKEELKLLELRTFEPKRFFNSGLEEFKRQLEAKYPLCEPCRVLVENVLRKQSRWLTQYKMLFFKEKPVNEIIQNPKKVDKSVRIFLTMLTSAMMYYPTYWPLPFIGAFLQTGAFVVNQTQKRILDAILTLLWICISLVGPLNELNLFKRHITAEWPPLENITEYHCVTILTVIIGLTNVTFRYKNPRSFKASFKKLDSPVDKKNASMSTMLNNSFEDFTPSVKLDSNGTSNYRRPPIDTETPLPKTTSLLIRDSRNGEKHESLSPSSFGNVSTEGADTGRKHILNFDGNSEQYSLNDSLTTLKTLSLGETKFRQTRKIPRIFKTKVYGSTSPDLFQRSIKSGTRKFILAPPKLKSPAQTSWVAGGYWQVGVEPPSLSRSSSQSSGFGSAGSNFGPSREPSVNKEIDKCSVVSDATQCCYTPRPSSANSLISCCQHASQIQFSRCESPVCNQSPKYSPNSLFVNNHSQSHFSPVHPEVNGCLDRCLTLHNQNVNTSMLQPGQRVPSYSAGYHNVLTNPVWLPVLLCGSLVFNIAVFCTILLR